MAEGAARLLLPVQQVVEVKPSTIRHSRPGPPVEEREQERGIDVLINWSGHQGVRLPGFHDAFGN